MNEKCRSKGVYCHDIAIGQHYCDSTIQEMCSVLRLIGRYFRAYIPTTTVHSYLLFTYAFSQRLRFALRYLLIYKYIN